MSTVALTKKKKIFWILTILIPCIILLVPNSETFTNDIQIFFAITVGIILWFCFELTDSFIPALVLPALYIASGITSADIVFAPWAQENIWMTLSAFLIIAILGRIGLLNRAAFYILSKFGDSYIKMLWSILVIGILFNLIFSGTTVIILMPIVYGIYKALHMEHTRAGAGLAITAMCAANMPSMMVYNPGMIGLAIGMTKDLGVSVDFLQCLVQNIALIPFHILIVFLVTKMFKLDMDFQGKEYFQQMRMKQGKITKQEKKASILLLLLFILLATTKIHGIAMGWSTIFVTVMFFLPGINIGVTSDIPKINYSMVVFMAACMSIGEVSTQLGIGQLLADLVVPVLENLSTTGFIFCVWALTTVLNVFMTPLAVIAAFTVPMAQIAVDCGINPVPVIYTMMQGLDSVFLPYEWFGYLFAFSFGMVTTKEFLSFFPLKVFLNGVYVTVVMVLYWNLIGLL